MFRTMKLPKLLVSVGLLVLVFTFFASPAQAQYYQPGGHEEYCQESCANIEEQCSQAECRWCEACRIWSESFGLTPARKIEEGLKSAEMNVHKWTIGDFEVGGETPGMLDNIMHGATIKILGCTTCGQGSAGARTKPLPGGALGSISSLITKMYASPPASSVEYFADLGKNLGIAKPAYAQGVGFRGLNPVLAIWKAFRNIVYLLFVLVFIIIGFAIMFRVKLDPQTVINIQNSLPKIVVALILVTFSYAIAGFLIDLVYVLISLIIALFGSLIDADKVREVILNKSLFEIAKDHFWFASDVGSQIDSFLGDVVRQIGAPGVVESVGSALAQLVIAIAIIFSIFKLFFSLLMSYISIIFGVISAPFMLMLEALPGQKGFGNWLKMMLSNIIVFPVAALVFVLGGVLIGIGEWGATAVNYANEGWVPPLVQIGGGYTRGLIGIGIILLAPSIVEAVKKAVAGEGLGLARGIGAPIAGAWGAVSFPVRYPLGLYREAREKAITQRLGGLSQQEPRSPGRGGEGKKEAS